MKKFAKKSLFFLVYFGLFSLVINSAFLGLIATTDWDFVKRLESLKFENPDFELLVFGTSLAEYGIDTEYLSSHGVKSFNMAFVGSSVKTNYIQLDEYLKKYKQKPKYVILGLNSYLERFDQDGIQPVIEFTMKGHKYGLKDIPISKFNWAGMELIKKALRSEYRKTYVSCGQKRSQTTVYDDSNFKEQYIDLKKFESAYWIGEMAKLCDQHEIEFIVLDMPGTNETQNLSEIGPSVLQLGNGHSAKLYNLNSQIFCEFIEHKEDWAGLSHLNEVGASKFTMEMFKIIPFKN